MTCGIECWRLTLTVGDSSTVEGQVNGAARLLQSRKAPSLVK
jgi:hypothetical protein